MMFSLDEVRNVDAEYKFPPILLFRLRNYYKNFDKTSISVR